MVYEGNTWLALEKVEGPTTCLSFLGIILDLEHMEVRLLDDKLARIQGFLVIWLDKEKLKLFLW